MKKRLLSILLVATMLLAAVPAFAIVTGAEITVTDWTAAEIVLYTAEDYKAFHDQLVAKNKFDGQTVKLGADIDLTGITLAPIPETTGFGGVFDGQYHTVSNFKLSDKIIAYSGAFFGALGAEEDATIRNLGVVNATASSWAYGGLLYGNAHGALTVENVYCNASLTNTATGQIGGYVGRTNSAGATLVFKNCVFDGSITNNSGAYNYSPFVGVIVTANSLSFENCLINGKFTRNNGSGGEWLGAGKFICTNSSTTATATYTDCIQYNDYYQNQAAGQEWAVCPQWTAIGEGLTAKTPDGFTALNSSYPVPTALLPFFADRVAGARTAKNDGVNLVTEFYGIQLNADKTAVRLVGAVNSAVEDLSAVGYEVTIIRDNGKTWSATLETQSVYTSVLEEGKTASTSAAECGGSYVYVAALDGLQANKGIVTLMIKTYSVDQDNNKTYTDVSIVSYDSALVA